MIALGIIEMIVIVIVSTVIGTGLTALLMVHLISHSNEMGENAGEFQDFVPGNIEIKREKDYMMNV